MCGENILFVVFVYVISYVFITLVHVCSATAVVCGMFRFVVIQDSHHTTLIYVI